MDDFNVSSLNESKNAWTLRLVNILTPCLMEGMRSILEESVKICQTNGEIDKYLLTFQNFVSRVPKWNASIRGRAQTNYRQERMQSHRRPSGNCQVFFSGKSP